VLIVLGAADGIAMAFNIPAWQVLTPRLVPREELTAAITLNGLQFNLARALGPALAGLLLSFSDVSLLFLLNTASYAFVLIAVSSTPDAPAPKQTQSHPWLLISEAWRYVLHHKGPLYLILGISVFSMLATPLLRMMPILVKEIYFPLERIKGWSFNALAASGISLDDPKSIEAFQERAFGLLLGTMGLGAVAGALTIRRIPAWYPKHHFVPLSITMCGLAMCAFSAATSIWIAGASVFVVGIFWMWSFNAAFSALQMLVEDQIRGRVLAICNTISFGCMPLGAVLAGAIGEFVAGKADSHTNTSGEGLGAQVGLGVLSVALSLVGMVMLIWRTPEVDGIQRGDPGYDRRPGLIRGITASAHRPARISGRSS
jgi:predicted MFS family arabinose efflux permease